MASSPPNENKLYNNNAKSGSQSIIISSVAWTVRNVLKFLPILMLLERTRCLCSTHKPKMLLSTIIGFEINRPNITNSIQLLNLLESPQSTNSGGYAYSI